MTLSIGRTARALTLSTLPLLLFPSPLMASDMVVRHGGEPGSVTRSIAVDLSDLDRNAPGGRASAERRITIAAHKVCGFWTTSAVNPPMDYKRCFAKATADARGKALGTQTALR